MGNLKVQNGTPAGNESLCHTRRWARVTRGYSEMEEIVFCRSGYPGRFVSFQVRFCTEYHDKRIPYKEDLEKIAYILVPKSASRTVGFLTPEQNREKGRQKKPKNRRDLPVAKRRVTSGQLRENLSVKTSSACSPA